jgi:hypothetical protein
MFVRRSTVQKKLSQRFNSSDLLLLLLLLLVETVCGGVFVAVIVVGVGVLRDFGERGRVSSPVSGSGATGPPGF